MKHIHRYQKANIGIRKDYWVMKCIKPGCNHYTGMSTKNSAPILRGKQAECNRCGEVFLLNKRAIQMANPCCEDCVKHKKNLDKADEFFKLLEESVKI